ncbi:hypothetical protein [Actinotalea sp. C106]|uniref:hypothetical protein n=1 Tax=Actinotalea sp. C106 TaxID=2908644 RepID=UPI0020279453|nr:hypothetical protein [Actinotalea sp. C106]
MSDARPEHRRWIAPARGGYAGLSETGEVVPRPAAPPGTPARVRHPQELWLDQARADAAALRDEDLNAEPDAAEALAVVRGALPTTAGWTRDQRRSLVLNVAVAGKVAADPAAARELARRNLERMRRVHEAHGPHRDFDAWEELLDGPLEDLLLALTDPGERGRDLRQNSPFAGLLGDSERAQVLAAWKAEDARREATPSAGEAARPQRAPERDEPLMSVEEADRSLTWLSEDTGP